MKLTKQEKQLVRLAIYNAIQWEYTIIDSYTDRLTKKSIDHKVTEASKRLIRRMKKLRLKFMQPLPDQTKAGES